MNHFHRFACSMWRLALAMISSSENFLSLLLNESFSSVSDCSWCHALAFSDLYLKQLYKMKHSGHVSSQPKLHLAVATTTCPHSYQNCLNKPLIERFDGSLMRSSSYFAAQLMCTLECTESHLKRFHFPLCPWVIGPGSKDVADDRMVPHWYLNIPSRFQKDCWQIMLCRPTSTCRLSWNIL